MTECQIWTGSIGTNGYGLLPRKGWIAAHRWAYEQVYGPVPKGLDVEHICEVRACVNPEHLRAVTRKENMARSAAPNGRAKTHCLRGHERNEANTRVEKKTGLRTCRVCQAEKKRRTYDPVARRLRTERRARERAALREARQ